MAQRELAELFETPQQIYSEDERRKCEIYQPWQSRQEALSLLLSLETQTLPAHIIEKVC